MRDKILPLLKTLGLDALFLIVVFFLSNFIVSISVRVSVLGEYLTYIVAFLVLIFVYSYLKFHIWKLLIKKVSHWKEFFTFNIIFFILVFIGVLAGFVGIKYLFLEQFLKVVFGFFILIVFTIGYVYLQYWQLHYITKRMINRHNLFLILGIEILFLGLIVGFSRLGQVSLELVLPLLMLVINACNRIILVSKEYKTL